MIGTLLTFLAMGIVSIVVVWIVLSVVSSLLGLTLGIAGFLLFKVAPVMLLGWAALKLWAWARGNRGYLSAKDRRWLERE